MELNAEQIKKALKYCTDGGRCFDCQYDKGNSFTKEGCMASHMRDALSLITSQEQKIKELTEENERMSGKVAEYEEERKYHFEMSRKRIAEAKADTVREMQERLKGNETGIARRMCCACRDRG